MKHSEIYDKHADRRPATKKKNKGEGSDRLDRKARASFKNYIREMRQHELEQDFSDED